MNLYSQGERLNRFNSEFVNCYALVDDISNCRLNRPPPILRLPNQEFDWLPWMNSAEKRGTTRRMSKVMFQSPLVQSSPKSINSTLHRKSLLNELNKDKRLSITLAEQLNASKIILNTDNVLLNSTKYETLNKTLESSFHRLGIDNSFKMDISMPQLSDVVNLQESKVNEGVLRSRDNIIKRPVRIRRMPARYRNFELHGVPLLTKQQRLDERRNRETLNLSN
jgi:hypothetical protein